MIIHFLQEKYPLIHTFVEHFKFVKQFEDENTVARKKIPAQFLFQMIIPENEERTKSIYPNEEELIQDIANAYKKVIQDLYVAKENVNMYGNKLQGIGIEALY